MKNNANTQPDNSGLRQIKIYNNNVIDYEMTLLKNSGEKIINLGNSIINSIQVGTNQVYTLSFTVPYFYTDDITLEIVKNEEYDLVKEKQIVQLNGVDKFIIETISENEGMGGGNSSSVGGNGGNGTTATTKTVTAYSLETQLNTRKISLPTTTRQLYANSVEKSAGYLDLVDEVGAWKLNYIAENATVENINGTNVTKYREVPAVNTFVYPFLNSTLAPLFNIIVFFNSHNKTYDVFNADSYGEKRDIIMCLDNIVTQFEKTNDIQKIITRLHAIGQNNLVFTQVNPLGTDYIDDVTPFRNSTYMSKDLLNALDRYDKVTVDLHSQFLTLRTQLTNQQELVDNLTEQVDNLKSNQITYGQEQSALLKTLSGYPNGNITISQNLKDLQAQITDNNNQLATVQAKYKKAETDLNNIMSKLQAIGNEYDMNNTTDSEGKIFTQELIDEYDNFILEGNYSNSSCITPEELYTQTKKEIVKMNTPNYTFNLAVDDFLDSLPFNEEEKMNLTLNLGDLVRIQNTTMSVDRFVRFVGYHITPTSTSQQGTLTLTFSTTNEKQDSMSALGATINSLTQTAHEVDINKYYWNMSKDTANWVEEFRTNSLNLVAQAIKSRTSENIIDISENGIYLTDANNPKEQLALTNNIIAMTTDGWESAEVAITPQWINGKLICAESIATESLSIATQSQLQTGQKALDGIGTLTQEFNVTKGQLESRINEKIGEDQMWADLKQNDKELSSILGETTAISNIYSKITQTASSINQTIDDVKSGLNSQIEQTANSIKSNITDVQNNLQSQIEENANQISSQVDNTQSNLQSQITQNAKQISLSVTKDGFGTELTENAKEVVMAWNSTSSSIVFENGEIICKSPSGTLTIGGDGIKYSRQGQNAGLSVASFVGQTKLQNGVTGTIQLPEVFCNLNMGTDFQVVAWAGNVDSNYNEVFDHDAIRNIFIDIVDYNTSTGELSVMPCLQKIGIQTLTMWGWNSQTTTAGNRQQEGMINVIIYAVMLTTPIGN